MKRKLHPSFYIMLGFMLIILIGAFLLALPISNNDGHWLGFVDSFFTSTSAVCVTGLVVVDTATQFSLFGQFVILFLIQVGGLGIVVLTSCIFLLLKKKINFSNRIVLKESFNRDTIQGVVKYLKKVILLTFIIEGVGAICLLGSTIAFFGNFWKGLFSAVFMSVSAFCNAGFDIFGNEMMQFQGMSSFASNVLMQLPIMMLIIIGGLGFIVLIEGFKKFKNNQHARVAVFMTIGLLVGGAIVFMFVEWNNPRTLGNMPWWQKVLNSFFQSTTTRTAGMATFDQAGLTPSGTILTILLMFIGGCPTSTSGGIKTTTLFIILLVLFKQPNENGHIVYKDRKISAKIIMKAFKIVMYMVAMLIISIVVLSLIEGDMYSVEVIIFECVSAISTVGLSMGITPLLSTASKVIVALLMFVGRVGMTTIVLALSTKSNKISEEVEYLNTDIIVG